MRSFIKLFFCTSVFLCLVLSSAVSQDKSYSSWNEVTDDMDKILDEVSGIYASGDAEGAKTQVNVAYYQFYEKIGFERTVKAKISGNRAGIVELQFAAVKKAIAKGVSVDEVKKEVKKLEDMLREDAVQLDPKDWAKVYGDLIAQIEKAVSHYEAGHPGFAKEDIKTAQSENYKASGFENELRANSSAEDMNAIKEQFNKVKNIFNKKLPITDVKAEVKTLTVLIDKTAKPLLRHYSLADFWGNFIASLLIILREGFEAILIVGAIIAYLVKSGNGDKLSAVYKGSIWGIVASFVMAGILIGLTKFGFDSGQGQEVVEGVTMFIAVLVLFYTSNWMLSKSSSKAWSNYIEGKVQTSVDNNSLFSLAFTCFLAVFREGAEVILFYQALFAGAASASSVSAILIGFAVGAILLVFVYLAIRFAGLKLPLKPFFLATSILMFVMCVSFVGSGISEFVDADWFTPTIVQHVPTITILGIHPYLEGLIGQLIMIVIIGATIGIGYLVQNKKTKAA